MTVGLNQLARKFVKALAVERDGLSDEARLAGRTLQLELDALTGGSEALRSPLIREKATEALDAFAEARRRG